MAGSRREYELLFKIQAALGGNFSGSFKSAQGVMKETQSSLNTLNSTAGKIDGYQKLSITVQNTRGKLQTLTDEHTRLQKEMAATNEPSAELQRQMARNEAQIEKTTQALDGQESKLNRLGTELRTSGIDTSNLTQENYRLSESYKEIKARQEDYARVSAAYDQSADNLKASRNELIKTVGVAAGLGTALYLGPVKSAMSFEGYMADVSKVVDGLKDSATGELTAEYHALKNELLDLTTVIPMTSKEITEIAAAAGQAGIMREEIAGFTVDAAKMGIAFDTTADQAGTWMAKWRTSFGMTQNMVVELSDKINYLGNTGPATAAEISGIVTKVGPLGEVAGFATGEIAAMGATLVGVGISEDVAATGIKKIMTTMTAGTAATKRQQTALKALNLDAEELAERMQVDATGALLDFMEAVKALPEAEQTSILKSYFGEEAVGSLAPMLTQLDLLQENFYKVGDASQYAGSMEAEYAARADTTENKVQLAQNAIERASITIGENFLPIVAEAAGMISDVTGRIAEYVQKNPEAVKTALKLAAAFLALKTGGSAVKTGFYAVRTGALGVEKVMKLASLATAGTGTAATGAAGAVGGLSGALGFFMTPAGAAIGAVGLLTAGVIGYIAYQKAARQAVLEFSKDLSKSADNFREVSSNAESTQTLIREYRELEDVVAKVGENSDEAAAAKERMRDIEQQLIDQNPDYLSKYDLENGKISENIEAMDRRLEQEKELARIQLAQEYDKAIKKLPTSLAEYSSLDSQYEQLLQQRAINENKLDDWQELSSAWHGIEFKGLTEEEVSAERARLDEEISKIVDTLPKSVLGGSIHGEGINGLDSAIRALEFQQESRVKELTQIGEDLTTLDANLRTVYDVGIEQINNDLGYSFEEKMAELAQLGKMKNDLEDLRRSGKDGSGEAFDLQRQIKEVEAAIGDIDEETLLRAAAEVRDLNEQIGLVPEVDIQVINLDEAIAGIDGFEKKLDQIPISKTVQLRIDTAKAAISSDEEIKSNAKGGIYYNPILTTFAEEGPEAAIPLDGSDRAKRLWAVAGQMLGMNVQSAAVDAGYGPAAPAVELPTVQDVPSGASVFNLDYHPTIPINGNVPGDLDEKLSKNAQELRLLFWEMIAEYETEKKRRTI